MTETTKNINQFATDSGKSFIKNILRQGKVTVGFTKTDGTERKMLCTLSEDMIPTEKAPKQTGKSTNDEVQPVFDLEKNDWRSFRFDTVTSITVLMK